MQLEKYEELEQRASKPERLDAIKQLEARARVHQEIEAMKAEGAALVLTDEEERMLRAFRRFKLNLKKDGLAFTWQTRRDAGVLISNETGLIVDPQEVSGPRLAPGQTLEDFCDAYQQFS